MHPVVAGNLTKILHADKRHNTLRGVWRANRDGEKLGRSAGNLNALPSMQLYIRPDVLEAEFGLLYNNYDGISLTREI